MDFGQKNKISSSNYSPLSCSPNQPVKRPHDYNQPKLNFSKVSKPYEVRLI